MPSSPCQDRTDWNYDAARRVTWISVVANIALGLLKSLVGFWGGSRALVADGVHSLTDLASDIAVLLGIWLSSIPPDDNHHYGHHKAVNLVTLLIGTSILVFCVAILGDSTAALLSGKTVVPHWPTLVTALISLATKEVLFHWTQRVGRDSHSSMLLANAWHHRTDSITSVITAAGIAATMLGGSQWAFLDAMIGIAMAGYLASSGLKLIRQAVQDLMDSAPGESVVNDLREHVLFVSGATGYHDFRVRRVGDMLEVDLHLLVPAHLSVREAHQIAAKVKYAIQAAHPEVLNVLIHIEPDLPEHRHDRGVSELSE